jgi:hypothetical protein
MVEVWKKIQEGLNAAGVKASDGNALKVDGIPGPLTMSALVKAFSGSGSGSTVTGTFTGKIK